MRPSSSSRALSLPKNRCESVGWHDFFAWMRADLSFASYGLGSCVTSETLTSMRPSLEVKSRPMTWFCCLQPLESLAAEKYQALLAVLPGDYTSFWVPSTLIRCSIPMADLLSCCCNQEKISGSDFIQVYALTWRPWQEQVDPDSQVFILSKQNLFNRWWRVQASSVTLSAMLFEAP